MTFFYLLVYMLVCRYVELCQSFWPNERRYRPEIRYTYSHRPYLKTVLCFFEKIAVTAASLEKLPCHGDFPHISSIALFFKFRPRGAPFWDPKAPKYSKRVFNENSLPVLYAESGSFAYLEIRQLCDSFSPI